MRGDKTEALKLRRLGNSYLEISQKLGVPKSTLSTWLSGIKLNKGAKEKINKRGSALAKQALANYGKVRTALAVARSEEIKSQAGSEFHQFAKEPLFTTGVSLYWAEGYKRQKLVNNRPVTQHNVSLTNADPLLIRVFIKFLAAYCDTPIDKVKAGLRLFDGQSEGASIDYWIKETGLPKENFGKVYFGRSISSQRLRPFNRLPHGTLQVRVYSTDTYYRIMGWIEELKQLS